MNHKNYYILIIFNYNVLTLKKNQRSILYYFKFECKRNLATMDQNLFLEFKNVVLKQRNKIILKESWVCRNDFKLNTTPAINNEATKANIDPKLNVWSNG